METIGRRERDERYHGENSIYGFHFEQKLQENIGASIEEEGGMEKPTQTGWEQAG